MHKKNILILDRSLTINGTSCYIKDLTFFLANKANLYFLGFKKHRYYNDISLHAKTIKMAQIISGKYKIDIMYACTCEMFFLALFLKKYAFKNAIVAVSIYHLEQCFYEKNIFGRYYEAILRKKMLESPESFIFLNEATKKNHALYYGSFILNSPVFPVLVNSPVQRDICNNNKNNIKVVSVGRLVDFKYHHEAVINALIIINSNRETPIEYHIYGEGRFLKKLTTFVKNCSAESFVFIHGSLKNEELYQTLMGSDIFVGMGTSLVAAASMGIPSIVAITSSELTYGFFTDAMQGFEFGEDCDDYGHKKTYLSVFTEFLSCSSEDLCQLRCNTISKGMQYQFSTNIDKLLNLLIESPKDNLTGISWLIFAKLLMAKIGLKFMPKQTGDK